MAHVDTVLLATGFTVSMNVLIVALAGDDQFCLWILARRAKDEHLDKGIKEFSKSIGGVRPVDNVAVVSKCSLGAELATEELSGV